MPEAGKALTKVTEEETTPDVIVRPAVTPAQAKEAWKEYQELKKSVLNKKEDVQVIQGREFLKKSYWRKLATFFNLSVDVVDERKEQTEYNTTFHFVCKATAPNGRYAIGSGSCDLLEKGRKNTIHNARATAETRAWNRAVSNLVGGGEVSAEEVNNHTTHNVDTGKHEPAASAAQKAYVMKLTNESTDEAAIAFINEYIERQGGKTKVTWETLTKKQASWLIDSLSKLSPKKKEEPVPPKEPSEDVEPEEVPF